jgi:hypothetical protein
MHPSLRPLRPRRTATLIATSIALSVGVLALAIPVGTANAGVAPQANSDAPASTATVTLVHGVRGLLADVVVDGKTVLKGFAYERASAPMQLPAGSHEVQVFQANQPHTKALLDVHLTVKAGQVLTAAVGFNSSGGPKVFVFDNRLGSAAHSASSIVVRNVSQGSAPRVILDGKSLTGTVAPGGQKIRAVAAGTHTVGLKVDGSWLLAKQPVRAASGKAMVVYIVGRQKAKSIALVADSITPSTLRAGAVDSGGVPPVTTSSLLPPWASYGLVGFGLTAFLLLARRRIRSATYGQVRSASNAR